LASSQPLGDSSWTNSAPTRSDMCAYAPPEQARGCALGAEPSAAHHGLVLITSHQYCSTVWKGYRPTKTERGCGNAAHHALQHVRLVLCSVWLACTCCSTPVGLVSLSVPAPYILDAQTAAEATVDQSAPPLLLVLSAEPRRPAAEVVPRNLAPLRPASRSPDSQLRETGGRQDQQVQAGAALSRVRPKKIKVTTRTGCPGRPTPARPPPPGNWEALRRSGLAMRPPRSPSHVRGPSSR